MNKIHRFITGRIKSIGYAVKGAILLLTSEDAVITHLVSSVIFMGLGFYFDIDSSHWLAQCLAYGLLFSTEGLNTAVEKICDFIHPDFHPKIGEIKDISAGAVTFAYITLLVVLSVIYIPHLYSLFN